MSLTLEQILAQQDREMVEVSVWGGTLQVRSLTAGEQLALEARIRQLKDTTDLSLILSAQIAAYVSTEDGQPKFTEEQAKLLMGKRPAEIRKIINAGQKLNGWTPDEEEQIRKN